MQRLLIILSLALSLGACGWIPIPPGPPDPPDPTPTPEPPAPTREFDEMLLITNNGVFYPLDLNFLGAISCCGGGYKWPLFDREWVDYTETQTRGDVNFYHMRLGPFLSSTESEWDIGPYVEVNGRAELTEFNEDFWLFVEDVIRYAAEKGSYVEVDVIDGWRCKRTDVNHPWKPDGNTFGQDWWTGCGDTEILGDNPYTQFIRKVIRHTGKFGNVIYQDGNEIGLTKPYSPVWTHSLINHIRLYEGEYGFLHHPTGTNSGKVDVWGDPRTEYIELHQDYSADKPLLGKPTLVNEYNPNPAYTPQQVKLFYCKAMMDKTYFWYWRHSQTKNAMDETLSKLSESCDNLPANCPYATKVPNYVKSKRHSDRVYDQTPIVCDAVYCRRAGFTDGRGCCAVRPEGDPYRLQCELAAMGGGINYWITGNTGDLNLVVLNNTFSVRVRGAGEGILRCSFPKASGNECLTGQGEDVKLEY